MTLNVAAMPQMGKETVQEQEKQKATGKGTAVTTATTSASSSATAALLQLLLSQLTHSTGYYSNYHCCHGKKSPLPTVVSNHNCLPNWQLANYRTTWSTNYTTVALLQ